MARAAGLCRRSDPGQGFAERGERLRFGAGEVGGVGDDPAQGAEQEREAGAFGFAVAVVVPVAVVPVVAGIGRIAFGAGAQVFAVGAGFGDGVEALQPRVQGDGDADAVEAAQEMLAVGELAVGIALSLGRRGEGPAQLVGAVPQFGEFLALLG